MLDVPVGALTPIGALCLVLMYPYLQMARGKLHPQSTIERMVVEHQRTVDDIAHDRDEWRAAHRISETARQVHADQVDELLEKARTTEAFIRGVSEAVSSRGGAQ